jgi:hypothetical protein
VAGGVTLRSSGGCYLCAEGAGGGEVHANRVIAGPWETWTPIAGGFRAADGVHFLCAELGAPEAILNATRTVQGLWETFTRVPIGGTGVGPLHVDGVNLRTEDGRRWVMKGLSHFPLFLRDLQGVDLEPFVTQFDDVLPGVEITHRVTSVMGDLPARQGVPAMIPANYPAYWDKLPLFADRLAAHGHRLLLTIFADVQMFGWSLAQQQAHVAQVEAVLGGRTNVLFELVNQAAKNGIDPGAFAHPSWGLWSRDSGMESANPFMPAWDWAGYTGTRNRPNFRFSGSDMYYVVHGWNNATWGGTHVPSALVEPIGVDEVDNGGSRITDAEAYFQIGLDAAAAGFGAVSHTQNGASGQLLGPIQKAATVRMWQGAMAVEAVT